MVELSPADRWYHKFFTDARAPYAQPLTYDEVILSPPGEFQCVDLYLKKRWHRVQYLANEFWMRWRKDYLQSLQPRQKWIATHRNLQVDDIVVVVDDNLPRNCWRLAHVEETYPDADGLVRKVCIKIADRNLDESCQPPGPLTRLSRPVQKLVLLLPHEEREGRGIHTWGAILRTVWPYSLCRDIDLNSWTLLVDLVLWLIK